MEKTMDGVTGELEVLWPGGQSAVTPIEPAAREASLAGRRIAFLWNGVFRGEEIFPILQQALSGRFPGASFVGPEVFGSIFGGDERAVLERLPARLKEYRIDAVVCGVAC